MRGYCGFNPKPGVFFRCRKFDFGRYAAVKIHNRFRLKQIALMEPGQTGSWQDHDSERACYPGRRPAPGVLARRRVVQVEFDVFSSLLFLLTAAK